MNAPIRTLLTAVATVGLVATGAALKTGTQAAHANPTPTVTSAVPGIPLDGTIADAAAKVVDSVVNVSIVQKAEMAVDQFGGNPFGQDPFGNGFDDEQQQQQAPVQRGKASGVIVTAGGRILTNAHVVDHATEIAVTLPDGTEMPAKVVGSDPRADLAVIQLEGRVPVLKPIAFGDSSAMRLGDIVLAVGNPLGFGQAVTMGIISAKGRTGLGIEQYEDFIQTDAAINHGNSGGALVNLRGELIGIPTAILAPAGAQNMSFAIPTNMARPIMDMLVKDGRVSRGYLGIDIRSVTPDLVHDAKLAASRGVWVKDVQPGGPGARGGLQAGDVIIGVAGTDVREAGVLRNLIAMSKAGQPIDIEVVRAGQGKVTVHPVLGELPDQLPQPAQQNVKIRRYHSP
jgi:S1-C subfamily serine protease